MFKANRAAKQQPALQRQTLGGAPPLSALYKPWELAKDQVSPNLTPLT